AFAVLVRALGLREYAAALADREVRDALGRFSDGTNVSEGFKRDLAACIRLKIVEGYPDGTLKPRREMTRAEAATVVYRSCLIRADARPAEFSPDGDGLEDATQFDITTLRNRNASSWNLFITDPGGRVVNSMGSALHGNSPPTPVPWDGKCAYGLPLPDGTYYYRAKVTDREEQVFWSALKPVAIARKTLRGSVSPHVLEPGDIATVTAYTTGGPIEVLSATPWSGFSPMAPSGQKWRGDFRVPANARDGEYSVSLRALFRGTSREAAAGFRVEQVLSIGGILRPNPCRAGCTVAIEAWSSPGVVRVTASCPELDVGETGLERADGGDWTGSFEVPADTNPGRYVVTLTGRSLTKSVSAALDLLVDPGPLDAVTFSLTG
ncbi:MAG: S-layer homology domain-containing protein, partial [Firmicutes bacterium]|nr:S-layer homology domain-containing protein [Bacillota bacterium]